MAISFVLGICNYALGDYNGGYYVGSMYIGPYLHSLGSPHVACATYNAGGPICSSCPEEFTDVCSFPYMEQDANQECGMSFQSDWDGFNGCPDGAYARLEMLCNSQWCDVP